MQKTYIILALIVASLTSCITDTVDSMSKFTVQLPIFYKSNYENRNCPDATQDFSNLNEYTEYRDNKEKIEKAEVYQLNYRIDSLVMPNKKVYNPETDKLEFDYIKYYLIFAKPKTIDENSTDPTKFEYDLSKKPILLGEFKDVDIKNFYRQSKNILTVDDERTKIISDILKDKPYFFISTEYSKMKGSNKAKEVFPYIGARFDIVVRLGVKI